MVVKKPKAARQWKNADCLKAACLRPGSPECQQLLLQYAREPRSLFPTAVPTGKPSDAGATGTCAENKELLGFVSHFFTILPGRLLPAHWGPRPIPSLERARSHPAARCTRSSWARACCGGRPGPSSAIVLLSNSSRDTTLDNASFPNWHLMSTVHSPAAVRSGPG